jgi:hypothetical protein
LHKLESRRTCIGTAANLRLISIENERKLAMRKVLTTSILLLALCGSAYAGDMPNTSPTQPSGLAYGGEMPNDVAGNIPNDSPQDGLAPVNIIAESALAVLQSVLAAF